MANAVKRLNGVTQDDFAKNDELKNRCSKLIDDLKAAGRDDDAMTIEIAVAALGGK
jgi:hypothetical protein